MLPLLAIVVLGAIDVGRVIWTRNALGYATRDGARFASIRSSVSDSPATSNDVREYVASQVPGLSPERLVVTTTWQPDSSPGSNVRVAVTYDFEFLVPFLPEGLIAFDTTAQRVVAR